MDTASGIVKKCGKEVYLSALEYRLLLVFIQNPKNIITRDRLLDELWDAAGEFVNKMCIRDRVSTAKKYPKTASAVWGISYLLILRSL